MHRFLIYLVVMSVANVTEAQKISFCQEGLSLIHMGAKVDDSLTRVLDDIDTSDGWGHLELFDISFGFKDVNAYVFKKLQPDKVEFPGIDMLSSICVAFTKQGIIRRISIRCPKCDRQAVKAILDSVYGKPKVEAKTGYDGAPPSGSFTWLAGGGFNVFFSGIAGSISLSYGDADEYQKFY